jgi:hypothetical protein
MIDLQTETPIYLADVPAYLPKHPTSGKRVHINAIYRWARAGVRGVKLETIAIGGTLATSIQALQRFCDACTAVKFGTAPSPTTPKQRQRKIEAAERELAAAGL